MATTGKIRSNAINVYVSTVTGDTLNTDTNATDDTYEIVASSTSGTFSGELETIDATSKDNDGARSILVSAISWSMTVEGLVQYNDTTNKIRSADLFSLWQNKVKVRIAWATGIDGDSFYYGDAYITSYEESAGLNEVASFSVTFEGDGDITTSTIDTGAGGQTFHNTQY
jgi:TP901-1 family phage major tail protein